MTEATLIFGFFVAYCLTFVISSIIKGIFSLFFYDH